MPFSVLLRPVFGLSLSITAWDDDGGFANCSVGIAWKQGQPVITNLSPRITIRPPQAVREDTPVLLYADVVDYYDLDRASNSSSLTYTWNFGNGIVEEGSPYLVHTWTNAGEYLVQLTVGDGQLRSVAYVLLTVEDIAPIIDFNNLPSVSEDRFLDFQAVFYDTPNDVGSIQLIWDFGDGLAGTGNETSHAWKQSGTYVVTLTATDNNGVSSRLSRMVEVVESPPAINRGSLGFQALEGERAVLNFSYSDTIIDYPTLSFEWVLNGTSYPGLNPDFIQPPGEYVGNLTIRDADGVETKINVTIYIINNPPVVSVTNYAFLGLFKINR